MTSLTTFKSAFPLSVIAVDNNTRSLGGFQRPNIVGEARIDEPTVERWFNTRAFEQPAPFTFGNGPRTMPDLRAHGTNNFDASVQKYWGLWSEQSKLQFRAEFFNLFNRAAVYAPDTGFGKASLGQVFQAFPARSIQFGLKRYW